MTYKIYIMKKILKHIIIWLLGDSKFRNLQKDFYFKRNKNKVDELYLISKYFRKNNKNGVMIDVGVHNGQSSELFLDMGWKVYGFEPDEINKNKIPSHVINNSKMTLFECALSNENGEMSFYRSNESTGISSLLNFHETHKEAKKVPVRKLQEVIDENKIRDINVLKIDTEGYDLFVLKGLDINKYSNLDIIFCEFEDNKTLKLNYSVHDMADFLLRNDYKIIVCEWFPIIRYGVEHKFKSANKYPCPISENGWGNLLAYKNEKFEQYFFNEIKSKK